MPHVCVQASVFQGVSHDKGWPQVQIDTPCQLHLPNSSLIFLNPPTGVPSIHRNFVPTSVVPFHVGCICSSILCLTLSLALSLTKVPHLSGQSFLSPGDLPDPGIEPRCPAWWADYLLSEPLGKPISQWLNSCGSRAQLLQGIWDLPRQGIETMSSALAGRFFTTEPPGKPLLLTFYCDKISIYIYKKISTSSVFTCIIQWH